jgi:hypothetical protein
VQRPGRYGRRSLLPLQNIDKRPKRLRGASERGELSCGEDFEVAPQRGEELGAKSLDGYAPGLPTRAQPAP